MTACKASMISAMRGATEAPMTLSAIARSSARRRVSGDCAIRASSTVGMFLHHEAEQRLVLAG